jgi:hypothetical protein
MTGLLYLAGLVLLTLAAVAWSRGEWASLPGLFVGAIFVGVAMLHWWAR